ncbi:MAG: lytic transglycosylase domain-containing protein [Armatimonadota bacterium]|nr:lytic transglycosylase domain-containing protein [Armatimonadota bacterium]MDR7450263.1 lytic transglycosylase domain-containing protein [Armatimonadota bacterium]MDR7467154.1 lytic transglycosylase domain-containing protein [Armatimonadota bacterium]MDR7493304.1 lytic transglycosylase domain-containing protein [Armatimonadota bacterium]MDR7500153.1 lytic transglycosylase domain-containing protein [Armatimonadota bacterium]
MRMRIRVLACGLALVVLIAVPGPAFARPRKSRFTTLPLAVVKELVRHYAARYGVPLHIAHNLIAVESGWRQTAVSRRGARGLMQIRPVTARGLRVNPYDTRQNIEGGMRYLRHLYNRFQRWDLALAGYHSGPNKVLRSRGIPPKSRAYVRRILAGADPVTGRLPQSRAASKPAVAAPPPAAPAARAEPAQTEMVQTSVPFSGTRRRLVAATGDTRLIVVEKVQGDVVTARTEELLCLEGEKLVRLVRRFQLVDGVLTLVAEQTGGETPNASEDAVQPENR